jgi:phytoene dehydrogenase-like protein
MSGARDHQLDAVVVGSGPNGLAAAITLAREGRRVSVLEAAGEIGGGARSSGEVLPGYVVDTCSAVHPFGRTSPFFASADLSREGLRWVEPPVALAHPLDGGRAVLVTRDVEATARQLGRDRDAYRRLAVPLRRRFGELIPDILAPFHLPLRSASRTARLAWFGLHALQPATLLARRFRDDPAQALLAGAAAHSVLRLDEPVSGASALVMLGSAHHDGWPFPEGGAGSITAAMAARLTSLGGTIETRRPVGRARDLPAAELILFDTSPVQVAAVAGPALPSGYRRQLRAFRYGPAVFKLDIAIDGEIPWEAEGVGRAGTVHVGGTFEEIAASEADANAGRISDRPFVLLAQQSVFDRTRAPHGRNAVWAYCHVPNGSTADMTDAILGQVERFAPGFRNRILAVAKTTPADLEARNPNNVGGDMTGGRMSLGQLFTRPDGVRRILDPYTTPDPRTFIASSSTPPGGGVHGMCGWHAARSALSRPR